MSITAMKQALEALEIAAEGGGVNFHAYAKELRQAIEQAEKQDGDCQQCGGKGCVACDAREQEPVAWMNAITKEIYWRNQINSDVPNVPLYTHPQPKREWVGLTDEEFEQLLVDAKFTRSDLLMIGACVEDICNMVEAKLKEKNT